MTFPTYPTSAQPPTVTVPTTTGTAVRPTPNSIRPFPNTPYQQGISPRLTPPVDARIAAALERIARALETFANRPDEEKTS